MIKSSGITLFKTRKFEFVYPVRSLKMIPYRRSCIRNMWDTSPRPAPPRLFEDGPMAVFKTIRMYITCVSRISSKAHKISENYVVEGEGGEGDKVFGDHPIQDTEI